MSLRVKVDSRVFAFLAILVLANSAGAETEPRTLVEIGRDYPETRLFTGSVVRGGSPSKSRLAVGGFTRSELTDAAQLTIYRVVESGLELEWQQVRGGSESSSIRTLRVADLNGDGNDEIVCLGRIGNEDVDSRGALQVFGFTEDLHWHCMSSQQWQSGTYTHGFGMDVADLDKDGTPEIVTSGFFQRNDREHSELRVWKWDQSRLQVEATIDWNSSMGHSRVNSICLGDVTGDGVTDIVTAGRGGQLKATDGKTLAEYEEVIVWMYRASNLSRVATYQNTTESNGRFREMKLVPFDKNPGLEIIAVGRMGGNAIEEKSDSTNRRIHVSGNGGGRGDGSGGGRGDSSGGGRGRGDGSGDGRGVNASDVAGGSYPVVRPLGVVLKLEDGELKRAMQLDFGKAVGEVRDVVVLPGDRHGVRLATITASSIQPHRQARLELWEADDHGLHRSVEQTVELGDETRARQLITWDQQDPRLYTVGFVQHHDQILGQILDWGSLSSLTPNLPQSH